MRHYYCKLVRDRIPDIIKESGHECLTSNIHPYDYMERLKCKLEEEVAELINELHFGSRESVVSELTDIIEVCYAVAGFNGYSGDELNEHIINKAKEKGSFSQMVELIWADEDDEPHE